MCDSRASPLKLSYIYVLRLEQFGTRSSLLIEILNMEGSKCTYHSRICCLVVSRPHRLVIRLAVSSRNVAIYISSEYIVRQTKYTLYYLFLVVECVNHFVLWNYFPALVEFNKARFHKYINHD